MKKVSKIILGLTLVLTMLGMSFNISKPINVQADAIINNQELIVPGLEWHYLDDQTDPNIGTWYEEWNKRNGWAYPLDFLDWGTVPMRFDDALWPISNESVFSTTPEHGGTQLTKNADGTVGPTYYFRHTFTIDKPEDIVAISGKVRYNDAIILYVNGKPVESLFNIPISNYPKNLAYGCTEKVMGEYIEEEFIMEDVSSLRKGLNTISVELHASDEMDTDAYFELMSFILNPASSILPETASVKNVAVNTGANESELNFAWYGLSSQPGKVQITQGTSTTGAFPEANATTILADSTELAYTKFYDKTYYSNKAVFKGLELGKGYIYRVGNDDAWSPTYQLKTQDISNGYEVLFVSDAQIGTGTIPTDRHGWNDTLEKAMATYPNVSFIANTGDMVDVATKEVEYDAYFAPDKLTEYPTATAVGNHDISANYGYHYNEPNLSGIGANEANSDYYFIYGDVLYLVLNTNNTNNSEHIAFMKKTMEQLKGMEFSWTVAMFHQSIYSAAKQSTQDINIQRREELVPTFDELEIDIALMGHDHCYVRSHHMKNFEVQNSTTKATTPLDPEGTLYLTTSSASGSKYYDLVGEQEYAAMRQQFYVPTYMHLSFTDDTFTMKAYRTDTNEMFDTYTMQKTPADKSTLEALLTKAKAVDTSLYTEESVAVLNASIDNAQAVMDRPNASHKTLESTVADLQQALDNLVLKTKVEIPTDKGTPTNNGTSTKVASTGDYMEIPVYIISIVCVSVSIFLLLKKRKNTSIN